LEIDPLHLLIVRVAHIFTLGRVKIFSHHQTDKLADLL
jgi:hypothetical protein